MNRLYNDFWLNKMPIETIAHKYFQFTNSTLTSPNNIAYTNARCDAVAKDVRQKLGKTSKYEVGEIMICRKYLQKEGTKFNVNIRYKILHQIDDKYVIQDIKQKTNNEKLVTRQWLWTAITRCRDFKQVYFYLDDGQLTEIKQNFLANYLKTRWKDTNSRTRKPEEI